MGLGKELVMFVSFSPDMVHARIRQRVHRGFGLVEALVMIVMAGSLLAPILGTLGQGITDNVEIRHRRLAHELAQAKKAEILAGAPYQGSPLAATTEISTPEGATLTVSVTLSRSDEMAALGSSPLFPETRVPGFLWHFRIDVERFEAPEAGLGPASLTTLTGLVHTVPPQRELIYAACPSNNTIYGIDPKEHLISEVFPTPSEVFIGITLQSAADTAAILGTYKPIMLAVHPSGQWLAIKSLNRIFLMDIRRNSLTYGKIWVICDSVGTMCANAAVTTSGDIGENGTRNERGIAFRPDGRYLYFTASQNQRVYVLEVPATIPGPSQWSIATNWVISGGRRSFLEIGDDGMIYQGEMNSSVDHFRKFNSHTHSLTSHHLPMYTVGGKESHQRGLATTWGGHELIALYCGYYLSSQVNFASTHFSVGAMTGNTYNAGNDHFHNGVVISPDNIWAVIGNATTGNQERFSFMRLPLNPATFGDQPGTWNRSGKIDALNRLAWVFNSPYGKECIGIGTTGNVYFPSWSDVAAGGSGNYTSGGIPFMTLPAVPSDVAGRLPERIWIGCAEGGNFALECLDLYGGPNASGALDPLGQIALTAAPSALAVTPGGDKVGIGYSTASRPQVLDPYDFVTAMPAGLALDTRVSGVHKKAVWLLDRSLVTLVEDTGIGTNGVWPSDIGSLANADNGFRVYPADAFGNVSGNPTVNYTLPGLDGWRVRDVVPLHRRPGAFILMSNETTTPKEAALFWIEKSRHGGLTGTEGTDEYKLMYFWRTLFDGFPEGCPRRLALSPDDTTLILYDPTASPRQKLRFYDLNNQRFPMRPGLNLFVHQAQPDGQSTKSYSTPLFNSVPLNLKRVQTDFWTDSAGGYNPRNYPANFFFSSAGPTLSNVQFRFVRHFGYLHNPVTIGKLAWTGVDHSRVFLANHVFGSPNPVDSWGDDRSWYSYDFMTGLAVPIGCTLFATEFQKLTGSNNNAHWVSFNTSAALNVGGTYSSNPYRHQDTGGADYHIPTRATTRAWRFRPQLLREISFDGSAVNGLSFPAKSPTDGDSIRLCFNRDTTNPVLYLFDNTTKTFMHINLFPIVGFPITIPALAAETLADMAVSPDGRRLILLSDSAKKVFLVNISYRIPFISGSHLKYTGPGGAYPPPTEISLPYTPVCLGLRSFNGFWSTANEYKSWNNVSGVFTNDRCGNQTCDLGPNGIYIIGGGDGHSGAAQSESYRYDPLLHFATVIPPLPSPRRHAGVISYDQKIFALGGYNSGFEPSVFVFDPIVSNAWTQLENLKSDGNADQGRDCHGVSLTPYGMVTVAGANSSTISSAYFPQAIVSSTPTYGETFALPGNAAVRDNAAVTHFSRKDRKWYLFRIGGGSAAGTAASQMIQRFDFDTNSWSAAVSLGGDAWTEKTGMAACSWGDEIFIFGGARSNTRTPTAIAFNPDQNTYRLLRDVGDPDVEDPDIRVCMMAAVPCGPFIYLFDGADVPTGSGGIRRIRRYKP
jgi:DNA-binding beta-propeller fold protein YncE